MCTTARTSPSPPHLHPLSHDAMAPPWLLVRAHVGVMLLAGAAVLFRQAYEADPRQLEWLSLEAKQWSDASYLEECQEQDLKMEYNTK